MEDVHTFLKLAELCPGFSIIDLESYNSECMAGILSCASEGVDQFLKDWSDRERYKSKGFVGSITGTANMFYKFWVGGQLENIMLRTILSAMR